MPERPSRLRRPCPEPGLPGAGPSASVAQMQPAQVAGNPTNVSERNPGNKARNPTPSGCRPLHPGFRPRTVCARSTVVAMCSIRATPAEGSLRAMCKRFRQLISSRRSVRLRRERPTFHAASGLKTFAPQADAPTGRIPWGLLPPPERVEARGDVNSVPSHPRRRVRPSPSNPRASNPTVPGSGTPLGAGAAATSPGRTAHA